MDPNRQGFEKQSLYSHAAHVEVRGQFGGVSYLYHLGTRDQTQDGSLAARIFAPRATLPPSVTPFQGV